VNKEKQEELHGTKKQKREDKNIASMTMKRSELERKETTARASVLERIGDTYNRPPNSASRRDESFSLFDCILFTSTSFVAR
jgi:ribosomal protein S12